MIVRWSNWRRGGADGREAIAATGDKKSAVSDYTAGRQCWGKLTSRRDLEYLAWKLGCSVESVKRAIAQGLL